MSDHHPECEDATGAYPGSCTCAVIKRREAMDDLIAQDADLIEICPDDLMQRLKGHSEIMERDKGKVVRFIDVATCTEAAYLIEALTAENFKLAAGSCDVEGGKVGDEHGHFYCTLQNKVEAQAAEIERLREALKIARDAGIEAAANALEADAKKCDCFAYEENECACGAWADYKTITSARAVEIVRALATPQE